MKIISWNVNGIRAVHNKSLFMPFIAEHQPDILCLQETKAQPEQSPLDLPNYNEYWNSAERKGYSGTAIFSKTKALNVFKNIPDAIAQKHNLTDDGYGDPNKEGRVIVAEFQDFYVVSVYTPNAKDDLSRIPLRHKNWDPAFLEYMCELEQTKPVVFGGDLNVAHTADDLARPKDNVGVKGFTNEEREGVDKIISKKFVDTFRLFTSGNGYYSWWSHFAKSRERNVGWRIDYFFVSSLLKDKVKAANILPNVLGSDHCPVVVEIEI